MTFHFSPSIQKKTNQYSITLIVCIETLTAALSEIPL